MSKKNDKSLPLVGKKYESWYTPPAEFKRSYLLTKVCVGQINLMLQWCEDHGVTSYEDTHNKMIVDKKLLDEVDGDFDEFTDAKDAFFRSIGVNDIDQMNEFSQGWDGFNVKNMDELIVKFDVATSPEILQAIATHIQDLGLIVEVRPDWRNSSESNTLADVPIGGNY